MRPTLALVLLLLVTMLFSAGSFAPGAPEGVRGWGGPHPSQLVSYRIEVPLNEAGGWTSPTTAIPSIPGNGLVITQIKVENPHLSAQRNFGFRLLQGGTEEVFALTDYPSRNLDQAFSSGLAFEHGVPLTVQVLYGGDSKKSAVVHLMGYTW